MFSWQLKERWTKKDKNLLNFERRKIRGMQNFGGSPQTKSFGGYDRKQTDMYCKLNLFTQKRRWNEEKMRLKGKRGGQMERKLKKSIKNSTKAQQKSKAKAYCSWKTLLW